MASRRNQNAALLFPEHPVLTLDLWERKLGGPNSRARAVEQAKYYAEVGRLRRLARGPYAVTPIGTDPRTFLPDPYLVAAALRPDAILSHHSDLALLGHAHSVFHHFPYFTAHPRRTLRIDGREWPAVPHPAPLVRKRRFPCVAQYMWPPTTCQPTCGPPTHHGTRIFKSPTGGNYSATDRVLGMS